MIERWGVTAIAVLDLLMAVLILFAGAQDSGHAINRTSIGLATLGAGLVLLLLDHWAWTRPAAVMAALCQVLGLLIALVLAVLVLVLG